MSSPEASSDSEVEMGMEYSVNFIAFKTKSSKTRIQITYNDRKKEIVKDPCDLKFSKVLLEQGRALDKAVAKQSLKIFSRFLLEHSVQVSQGLKCWNLLCSGLDCGIRSSRGMPFSPPEDIETYGNIAISPEEEGYYKVHLTPLISDRGIVTNLITLRKGRWYMIAGELSAATPESKVSSRPRNGCECEQCFDDDEENIEREVVEAIINPLEILSQRYEGAQVGALGTWYSGHKALVCRDKENNFRIIGHLWPETYEEVICDRCKQNEKVTRCANQCLQLVSGWKGACLDIVEPGSAAVQASVLDFCPLRFKELRKSLKRVTPRLDSLGVTDGGKVLSELARLVRATREEVVYVLNNDMSLVQPIIGGANCFLRGDTKGWLNSCETLTGSELKGRLFYVDAAGTWMMIGSGEKYGVSETETGKYHLDTEGENMVYGDHLDTKEFG